MALRLPLPSMETLALFHNPRFSLLPQFSSTPYLPSATARFFSSETLILRHRRRRLRLLASVGKEETELRVSTEEQQNASPEDLEYVRQIKRILELLKKNRDMTAGEVKLTIMIEDPREAERKRLLGIEDANEISREDLAAALDDVNKGIIPDDRVALRLLAEEMMQWPNLEVEAPKSKPRRSMYAKATDTGVDPREASRRLNMDWDSAVETGPDDESGKLEMPSVVGYGALYLVTALPVLIGISVVLVLFYNSLQ